jgi:thymidylate synthase
MKTYNSFTAAYGALANELLRDGAETCPRGQKTKELIFKSFCIENPLDRLPRFKSRNLSPSYLAAEFTWYAAGCYSTKWISDYAKFWSGISNGNDIAESAYGARIYGIHPSLKAGVDQWKYVVEELMKDPDSRRAVIHIRTMNDSLVESKDVPCTLSLHFMIRNGALDLMVHMRSSDIILGLVYDVPAFTLFQEAMANELNVGVGQYYHISDSLHVYEKHYGMLARIAEEFPPLNFPMRSMKDLNLGPGRTLWNEFFIDASNLVFAGRERMMKFAKRWENTCCYNFAVQLVLRHAKEIDAYTDIKRELTSSSHYDNAWEYFLE